MNKPNSDKNKAKSKKIVNKPKYAQEPTKFSVVNTFVTPIASCRLCLPHTYFA